ncbi:unannotated protein [freshwater metagenome]|uniref:Unannotated protein n=1 Tax=freshwater metagenome TaxID=449393 RepID=A0A6J5YKN3_9ZZZZ
MDDGAVHDTTVWVLPNAPETAVGAPGTVAGVTAEETAELQPALFVAFTVNVYAVPLVRPVTVHVVAVVVEQVSEPGEEVTV